MCSSRPVKSQENTQSTHYQILDRTDVPLPQCYPLPCLPILSIPFILGRGMGPNRTGSCASTSLADSHSAIRLTSGGLVHTYICCLRHPTASVPPCRMAGNIGLGPLWHRASCRLGKQLIHEIRCSPTLARGRQRAGRWGRAGKGQLTRRRNTSD